MNSTLVVSIDSSTTACKAIAWDRSGKAVAEGRAAYPLRQPQPAFHEQDAEDWWAGAGKAITDCVAQVDRTRIEAFSITHQRETFVPVDGDGKPLRNAILWSDERSREQVAWLERRFGRDWLHRLTGKPPSMTQSLPKIVWLIQNEPQTVQRTARFLDVQAFLIRHLTGEDVTSIASADPMGLIDMQRGAWATGLIEDLGLRQDQFAQLALPGQRIGVVSRSGAAATGLPEGLPVVAGAGDGHCAGLGANATLPERAYLNLGTAVVSGAVSDAYLCDRAFRTLIAPVPGKFFVEHVLRGGVFTVQWFVDKFASDLKTASAGSAERLLEEQATRVPAGCEGLMAVPYWNNVMNPYWDPNASGITIGWSGAHGRQHFYRAILEAIAFEQRLVGDAMMEAAQRRFSEYVTMGGGSKSSLWCQILADVTGVPIVRSTTTEATCLGAGILAAAAVGWYSDVTQAAEHMTGAAERFDPVPEVQAFYDQLYREVYKPLFPTLQSLVSRLTELTHGTPGGGV